MPAEMPITRSRLSLLSGLLFVLALLMALDVPAADAAAPSYGGASADAQTIAFTSEDQLVPGDTDLKRDIYQRSFEPSLDLYVTRQASTGPAGGNDAYDATYRGISESAATIFFTTAERLVGADEDLAEDVYAHLSSGATILVSAADPLCATPKCGNGNSASSYFAANSDGTQVFFATDESLNPDDTDNSFDVYARLLGSNLTELVSQANPDCGPVCGAGASASIFEGASKTGDKVFFTTDERLAAGDGDQLRDIYARDLTTGTTALVSTTGICPGVQSCDALYRGVSVDGDRVFFHTLERIGAGDVDEASDVYVWSGGGAELASKGDPSCAPSDCGNGDRPASRVGNSADGNLLFIATTEALTAGDGDTATDVYVRDLLAGTTKLVSTPGVCPVGLVCNADWVGSSADGSRVFFQTPERGAGDTDSSTDVYARELSQPAPALVSIPTSDCEPGCGNGEDDARFSGVTPDGGVAFFFTDESLSNADENDSTDVYSRKLTGSPATTLATPEGVCPLTGETGCHARFEAAASDGSVVVFTSAKRLTAQDEDSEVDIFAREASKTRLISAGNSIVLGPATPILTGTDPASPGSSLEPSLRGSASANALVKVYKTGSCTGAPAKIGSAEELAGAGVRVSVAADTSTTFRATATDASGISSGCSATAVTYVQAADAGGGDDGGGDGGGAPGGGGGGGGSGAVVAPSGSGSGSTAKPTPKSPSVDGRRLVPATQITFAPAAKTRVRRPVFRFADSTEQAGTRFLCRVDRRPWIGCSSPIRLKRLGLGPHIFKVKGSNGELAESPPVVRKFRVVGP